MTRSRRAGVEDRWIKATGEKTSRHGVGMRWWAGYVDDRGREHTKAFTRRSTPLVGWTTRRRRLSPVLTSHHAMHNSPCSSGAIYGSRATR